MTRRLECVFDFITSTECPSQSQLETFETVLSTELFDFSSNRSMGSRFANKVFSRSKEIPSRWPPNALECSQAQDARASAIRIEEYRAFGIAADVWLQRVEDVIDRSREQMTLANNSLVQYIRSIMAFNNSCMNVCKTTLNGAPIPSKFNESNFDAFSNNSGGANPLSNRRFSEFGGSFIGQGNTLNGIPLSSPSVVGANNFNMQSSVQGSFIIGNTTPPNAQRVNSGSPPQQQIILQHLAEAFSRIHTFGQSSGSQAAQSNYEGRILTIANPELSDRNDELLKEFSQTVCGFSYSSQVLARTVKSEHDPQSCVLPIDMCATLLKAAKQILEFLGQQVNALEYGEAQTTSFFVNRLTKTGQMPSNSEKGPLNMNIFRDDAAVLAANISAEFKRLRTTIICLMAIACSQFTAIHGRISAVAAEEWLEVNSLPLPDLESEEHPCQVLFAPAYPKRMVPSQPMSSLASNEARSHVGENETSGVQNMISRLNNNSSSSGDENDESCHSSSHSPQSLSKVNTPIIETKILEREDGLTKVMPQINTAENFLSVTCQHAQTQTELKMLELAEVLASISSDNVNGRISQFARRKSTRKSIGAIDIPGYRNDNRYLNIHDPPNNSNMRGGDNLTMRGFGSENRQTDMAGFGDGASTFSKVSFGDDKDAIRNNEEVKVRTSELESINNGDDGAQVGGRSPRVSQSMQPGRKSDARSLSGLLHHTTSGTNDWIGGGFDNADDAEEEGDFTRWEFD